MIDGTAFGSDKPASYRSKVAEKLLRQASQFVSDHPHMLSDIDNTLNKAISCAMDSVGVYPPDILGGDGKYKMRLPTISNGKLYMVTITIRGKIPESMDETDVVESNVVSVDRVPLAQWASTNLNDDHRQATYEAIEHEVIDSAISTIRKLSTVTCGDMATAKRAEETLAGMLENYTAAASNLSMSERQLIAYLPDRDYDAEKARVVVSFQYFDGKTRVYRVQAETWDDADSTWRPHIGDDDDLCSDETVRTMIADGKQGPNSMVDHPQHYGGADNPYEAIKVIEAWMDPSASYGFCIGNALKYICRAGKKSGASTRQDLEKAIWYLNRACEDAKTNEEETADKK